MKLRLAAFDQADIKPQTAHIKAMNGREMLGIGGEHRHSVLQGGGCDEGIAQLEAVTQGVSLDELHGLV